MAFYRTLQSNKINLLIKQKPILWHSCNGIKIAKAMDKRLDYKLNTLLEINSANENSKSGLDPNQAVEEYLQIQEECSNLNLCGVMSIGSHSQDKESIIKALKLHLKFMKFFKNMGLRFALWG